MLADTTAIGVRTAPVHAPRIACIGTTMLHRPMGVGALTHPLIGAFPDVSVWYVGHARTAQADEFDTAVTLEDLSEFQQIHHLPTRMRSLRTRAALREALTCASDENIDPLDWRFTRGAYGKPVLDGALPPLHFSCSHSPFLSVIAVSRLHPVGIDIALADPAADACLIDEFFSSNERLALKSLAISQIAYARARLWALREAVSKMLGMGLAYDVSELEFDTVEDTANASPHKGLDLAELRIATWSASDEESSLSVALVVQR